MVLPIILIKKELCKYRILPWMVPIIPEIHTNNIDIVATDPNNKYLR